MKTSGDVSVEKVDRQFKIRENKVEQIHLFLEFCIHLGISAKRW